MPLRSWLRRRRDRAAPTPLVRPSPPPELGSRPLQDGVLQAFSDEMLAPPSAPVERAPGLYTLPLLTAETVARLRAELDAAAAWCARHGVEPPPPNSMHRAGLMMEQLGLQAWAQGLAQARLAPLAAELFPAHTSGPPAGVHAFSVDYGPMGDRQLAQHVDDAAVTANLWLGGDAEGSAVVFEGVRCLAHLDAEPRPDEVFAWKGEPGEVLLHAGLHRHRTLPVGRGSRASLIFWLQDPEVRQRVFADADAGRCPDWCGARG